MNAAAEGCCCVHVLRRELVGKKSPRVNLMTLQFATTSPVRRAMEMAEILVGRFGGHDGTHPGMGSTRISFSRGDADSTVSMLLFREILLRSGLGSMRAWMYAHDERVEPRPPSAQGALDDATEKEGCRIMGALNILQVAGSS